MKDKISTEAIVEENFKGLSKLITDDDLLIWYKSLIVTCIESYHQQSLQQILEEAGEELPSLKEIDLQLQAMKYSEFESALWMRSEASKVVAKWKEKNVKLNKLIDWWEENCGKWKSVAENKDKEIQQLKEALANVRRALMDLDNN